MLKIIFSIFILFLVGCSGEKTYKRIDESGNERHLKIKLSEGKLSVLSSYVGDKNPPFFFEESNCIVIDKSNWKCGNIHFVNDELFVMELGKKYPYK